MYSSLISKIKCLNFELASKCALKCTRCARTTDQGLFKSTELPLNLIKMRFPKDFITSLDLIDLSGNYGDPIYHSDFLSVLEYFKEAGGKIYIETNGSGRSSSWWNEVTILLDKQDIVSFSVDGLEDTNPIYRVNSNWSHIMSAMNICAGRVSTTWKYIIFKHNEHQVDQATELAKNMGLRKFKLVKSSLFYFEHGEEEDQMMPSLENVNSSLARRITKHRQSLQSSNCEDPSSPEGPSREFIGPKCITDQRHFITAEGYYFPCCWIGHVNPRNRSFFKENLDELSLHNHSLEEILNAPILKKLAQSWETPESAPPICQSNCKGCEAFTDDTKNSTHSFSYKTLNIS